MMRLLFMGVRALGDAYSPIPVFMAIGVGLMVLVIYIIFKLLEMWREDKKRESEVV